MGSDDAASSSVVDTSPLYQAFLNALLFFFAAALFYSHGIPLFRRFVTGGSGDKSLAHANNNADKSAPAAFKSFQRRFLLVYLIMMGADWMQGPYVYRLYSYYGFSRHDNGVLFIAGFGASLVFGTWAGPMADRYGRKLNCVFYGIAYTLSCATKFVNNYWVLMLGRLLGGFATSILWSAFESWMVSEHLSRGFDPALIGNTFSLMITLNGLVAIGAGLVAQEAVDFTGGNPVAPFALSAAFLLLGTLIILAQWSENYGERSHNMLAAMKDSIAIVRQDPTILLVGLQQSLFEGAMYTFVFLWSPALEAPGTSIPYGTIFSCFMIACSLGGTVYGIVENMAALPRLMIVVFAGAALSMAITVAEESRSARMASFVLFEVCVGMFWPGIGTLRSRHIPEGHRATITNILRAPVNVIVCIVLYFQGGMTVSAVFSICALGHAIATIAAILLAHGYRYQAPVADKC